MRFIYSILTVLLLALGAGVEAQTFEGGLRGLVTDRDGKPMSGATIYLNRLRDSGLVKTAITSDSGRYEFTGLQKDVYQLIVTNVGFGQFNSNAITIDEEHAQVEMPSLAMTIDKGNTMNTVTVTAKKPFVERRIDRTIVNVNGWITKAGATAFEALQRSPGVRIDNEANVVLQGKDAVIYVDGKPTYLSSTDLAGYLKSMPAELLERIEIMPTPPSKYDAAGSGGLINIVTKKIRQTGFNGGANINYGQGFYEKLSGSLNMNYRIKKINLFGNVGYNRPRDLQKTSRVRSYKNSNNTIYSLLDQQYFNTVRNNAFNYKLGLDYYLNSKTTVGIIFNGASRPVKENGTSINTLYDESRNIDSFINSRNRFNNRWKQGTFNLNMVHQLNNGGSELSVDVDYGRYRTKNDQAFYNDVYGPTHTLQSSEQTIGQLPRTIDIYSAKADVNFSTKELKWEAGWKSSLVKSDNRADYWTGAGGSVLPDYEKSNAFLYDENINAAYLTGYREYKRLGIKLGLRVEQTYSRGHQLGNLLKNDSSFTRHYVNAFPSFYLFYKFDSVNRNQLMISYGRRISRPSYDQLNPFLSVVQRYYLESGNPFLKPKFSNNISVTHVFKENLSTNVYYAWLTQDFQRVVELSGDQFISRPGNIGGVSILGFMFSYNRDLFKWWNMDLSFNPEHTHLKSVFNGVGVDTLFWQSSINIYNRFSIAKGLNGELNWNWGSRSFTGQYGYKAMSGLQIGIRKDIMKNKATVSLNLSDIFLNGIRRGQVYNIPFVDEKFRERGDSRVLTLSFNYRFSKNEKEARRPRDRNGVWEEQSRIGKN